MSIQTRKLNFIIIDQSINILSQLDESVIEEYQEAILEYGRDNWQTEWLEYPKITEDGHLWSGFHTIEAVIRAFGKDIYVQFIIEGKTRDDAYLLATGENSKRGRKRTNEEKREVVLRWLLDKEGRQWSNGYIAQQCNVSPAMVAEIAKNLTINVNSEIYDPNYKRPSRLKYINKHGKQTTIETKGLGNKKKQDIRNNEKNSASSVHNNLVDSEHSTSHIEHYEQNNTSHRVYFGDNLEILSDIQDESIDLVYADPPFNTGNIQTNGIISYSDHFGDTKKYLEFLYPRFQEIYRVLRPTGSLFFHLDQRESHYCKVLLLDEIFGKKSFINEIIWSYDFGGRSNKRWAAKHEVIYWYAKNPKNYTFNSDERDRIPYLAPTLAGEVKAHIGKCPTDVWWHTIVPTSSHERTGYPTQKPINILRRIVSVHSTLGDTLLDPFAGSGTLGDSAAQLGRNSILIDNNSDAIETIMKRLASYNVILANSNQNNMKDV